MLSLSNGTDLFHMLSQRIWPLSSFAVSTELCYKQIMLIHAFQVRYNMVYLQPLMHHSSQAYLMMLICSTCFSREYGCYLLLPSVQTSATNKLCRPMLPHGIHLAPTFVVGVNFVTSELCLRCLQTRVVSLE